MSGKPSGTPAETPSRATYVAVAALAALVGFAAVYVTLSPPDNAAPQPDAARPAASPSVDTGKTASGTTAPGKETAGKLAAFVYKKVPEKLPEIAFVDGAGQPKTLEDFRGKTVLLNLWATWCAPCREEMPSLDRLQKALGSVKFEVVALAVDRNGLEAAKTFLADIKVESLAAYSDPTAKLGPQLKVVGMPTTILIDKEGREIGRLPGPAAWDSPEAKKIIEAALE